MPTDHPSSLGAKAGRDFALVPLDTTRSWPDTTASCRAARSYDELEADEEAQAALRQVGLA